MTLEDQGKAAEAEAMLRLALAIHLKALPKGHPLIATSYSNLADSLERLGKADEALQAWRSATAAYDLARSFGPRGLEAAIGTGSPLPQLAAALARARAAARGVVELGARPGPRDRR